MKRIRLTLLVVFYFQIGFAQNRFAAADSVAARVKGAQLADVHGALTQNLTSDIDKIRAFYSWIALNIRYDVGEFLKNQNAPGRQEPQQVLNSGKAVCHGYAALFREFCDRSGIPCYLVSGYTRLNGAFDDTGHTWNIVSAGGKWQPVDVTWGAGGVDQRGKYIREFTGKYFLTEPEIFLEDHFPFDPMWQILEHPAKLANYKSAAWNYAENAAPYFSYSDTIAGWIECDSLDREYTSALRMQRFNPGDMVIQEQLALAIFMKGNAAFDRGNKIMEVLFPRETDNMPKQSTPERVVYKLAQLDSIDVYYREAAAYYNRTQLRKPSDRQMLKGNLEALKYNMDVVKRERVRTLE